jgi:hypothetical protein
MVKIKLTKTAVETAQPHAQAVELRPNQPLFQSGCYELSATKKLQLESLPKTEKAKLTFACPACLKADLDRYAEPQAQTYGEAVGAATLIPHMPEAFIAGDRGFKKGTTPRNAQELPNVRHSS